MHRTFRLILALTVAAAVGCDRNDSSDANARSARPDRTPEFQRILSQEPLEDPIGIAEAQQSAVAGETITVHGLIGGIADPLPEGMAIMTLIDTRVPRTCGTEADGHCSVPWDYCCEPMENRKKSMASVQVLDERHMPYKQGLGGLEGLKPFAQVAVRGTVRDVQPGQRLILDAHRIHVISPTPPQ